MPIAAVHSRLRPRWLEEGAKAAALASLAVAVATLVRSTADPWLADQVPFPTYFAAVAVVALYGTTAMAVLTCLAGALVADVLFMPPRGSIAALEPSQWIALTLFVLSSGVIILLGARLRAHKAEVERSQEDLRAISGKLRAANERKDEFISTLAHELRNPLAPILNATECLRMLGSGAQTQEATMLSIIDRQAEHMKYLIDDLLDVARIDRGRIILNRQSVEITEVVSETLESLRPRCEAHGLTLTATLPAAPLWVHGDRVRITQMLDNLLDNACRFTQPGGSIRVDLDGEEGQCVLRVRDTGSGIDPSALADLFQPFGHVKSEDDVSSGGLGLGLHLVKRLAEKHGGSIQAFSEGEGHGSEFVLRLPLATTVPEETDVGEPPPKSRAPLRILVIDDNEDAARTLQQLLKTLGHDVHTATSGADGIAIAGKVEPQVALVDLRMPDMNGFEVARRLRLQQGQDLRVIAVTGYNQESHRARSRDAGFDEHLTKPVTVEVLTEVLAAPTRSGIDTARPLVAGARSDSPTS